MVAAPPQHTIVGGRNGGPIDPFLEHALADLGGLDGHGEPGVQLDFLKDERRDREHARVLAQPDLRLELPLHAEDHHPHRPHHEVPFKILGSCISP